MDDRERTTMTEDDARELYVQVLSAVAHREKRDILELPPLYDTIDTDALANLVDSMKDGEVRFRYCGYSISVDAQGQFELNATG